MMAGQVEFSDSVHERIAQKLIAFWQDRPAALGAYQVADALTPLFVELLNESLQVALDGRQPRHEPAGPSFVYRFNATPPGGNLLAQVPVTVSATTVDAARVRAFSACGDDWALRLLSIHEEGTK